MFLKLVNADGSVVGTTNGSYYGNVGDKPTQLGVYSQNYSRGTIDYMRYSWVDANGLLFAITGLFAIRQTCYIFSGVTVILAILIGAIRMKEYRLDNPGTDGKNTTTKTPIRLLPKTPQRILTTPQPTQPTPQPKLTKSPIRA